MFIKNVSTVDSLIRIVVGLVVLSLVFIGPQTLWGLIGIVLILTGIVNFCPLYTILGINTATKK